MFSIEKNYVREQGIILQDLHQELKQKLQDSHNLLQSYKQDLQNANESEISEIGVLKNTVQEMKDYLTELSDLMKEHIVQQKEYIAQQEEKEKQAAEERQKIQEQQKQNEIQNTPNEPDINISVSDNFPRNNEKDTSQIEKSPSKFPNKIDADLGIDSDLKDEQIIQEDILDDPKIDLGIELDIPEEEIVDLSKSVVPDDQKNSIASIDANPHYELLFPKDILSHVQKLNTEEHYAGIKAHIGLLCIDIYASDDCKTLSPHSYVKLYNKVFNQILTSIAEHRGTVNGYTGDSILACFGLFDEEPERNAADALYAVYAVQEKLQVINEYLGDKGLGRMDCAMGVHFGEVVVGRVGNVRPQGLMIFGDIVECVRGVSYASVEKSFVPVCSQSIVDNVPNKAVFGESFSCDVGKAQLEVVYLLKDSME